MKSTVLMQAECKKVRVGAESYNDEAFSSDTLRQKVGMRLFRLPSKAQSKFLTMLRSISLRFHKPRTLQLSRAFASVRPPQQLDLAFDFYESEFCHNDPDSCNAPIIFLHGLFGSKKNNRSMSR